ncbi:MAG: hypothetical protein MZV70_40325 [Desulfobacterales bacterium]|nr:hypothetical protein [Desulfobacterales bacterium]
MGCAAQYKNAVFYGVIGLLLAAAVFPATGFTPAAKRPRRPCSSMSPWPSTSASRRDQPQAKAVQEVAEDFQRIFTSLRQPVQRKHRAASLMPTCATRSATSRRPPSITRPH